MNEQDFNNWIDERRRAYEMWLLSYTLECTQNAIRYGRPDIELEGIHPTLMPATVSLVRNTNKESYAALIDAANKAANEWSDRVYAQAYAIIQSNGGFDAFDAVCDNLIAGQITFVADRRGKVYIRDGGGNNSRATGISL